MLVLEVSQAVPKIPYSGSLGFYFVLLHNKLSGFNSNLVFAYHVRIWGFESEFEF